MRQCLGPFDNITFNGLRLLNKTLAACRQNKLKYEYTDGMLFLVPIPKKPKLTMQDHAAVNRDLRRYGANPQDVGK